jgi:hypothetical protein
MKMMPLLTRLSLAKGMTTALSTFGEPTMMPVAMIHCWLAAVKVRLSALVERVGMFAFLPLVAARIGTIPFPRRAPMHRHP